MSRPHPLDHPAAEPSGAADHAAELLGAMVDRLPGHGENRPGQQEMARLAAAGLDGGTSVVIRAGTGTGKSLAVLAAVAAVVDGGRRVVLATATKALQDQYVDKELPRLDRALTAPGAPRSQRWAVLKGRANYLCLARLDELRSHGDPAPGEGPAQQLALAAIEIPTEPGHPPGRAAGAPDGDQVAALLGWSATTGAGDLAELPFEVDRRLAPWVSSTSEGCPGASRCPHGETCWAERAIGAARDADLVVLNLALLGVDLALGSPLVGEVDAFVLDEAHEAEDVLSAAFGAGLGTAEVERLARHVRTISRAGEGAGTTGGRTGTGSTDRLQRSLRRTHDRLGELLAERAGRRLPDGLAGDPPLQAVVASLAEQVADVQRVARTAESAESRSSPAVEICRRAADRLAETTGRLLAEGPQDAVWVEEEATLRRVPVDLGERLEAGGWQGRPVLMTSATVTAGTAGRLGLGEAPFRDVGSPFEHREAAWLYVPELLGEVPSRLRSPSHPDWFEAAWGEAAVVLDAAEGRTLFLCTSMRNTERFAQRAREELDWPVLVQGERPKQALLEEFATDEHSVLFGTMGLWQGVDVPGPSLSCVIVDRLPFPRPDDPLWQARTDHAAARPGAGGGPPADAGYRAFLEVSVPRAATLLAQGTGRLIRSAADRGLVVVLDPRLAEKPYRREILRELPPMRRTRTRQEALAHLRS